MTRDISDVDLWLERQSHLKVEVDLSIVIPAFNERWRLPPTLMDIVDYMESVRANYEIIVVDDGSTDGTADVVRKFERIRPTNIRLIQNPENRGKGHAVRLGILNAKGLRVLFADADGATPIQEIERLSSAIDAGAEVAFGSRAAPSDETKVSTRWYRKYLGRAFNLVVNLTVLPHIADTQCGFKMFTARAARFLFSRQTVEGYGFDVEILYLAQLADIKAKEVPINWENVPGSKVNLVLDAMRMFIDIIKLRLRHRRISPAVYAEFTENFPALEK